MKKKTFEKVKAPKLSFKKLILDNWFLLKLAFCTAPVAMLLYALEQFRVNFMIFFEHTWLVKTVLECVQYGKPFSEALRPILLITAILAATSVLGSVIGQWLLPKGRLAIQTKLKSRIYEKAKEVDLACFDDPGYYNDFIMTSDKVNELVDYIIDIICVAAGALGTLTTTGLYFARVSYPLFFIILGYSAVHLTIIIIRNKIYYSRYSVISKYRRYIDYTKRLFYFKDFAKEIRLSPDVKEASFEKFDKTYDDMACQMTEHDMRIGALNTVLDILSTGALEAGAVIWLVWQATVLHEISYSSVVVMMSAVFSLRRSFVNIIYKIATSAENCLYVEKINTFLGMKPGIVSEENLPVSKEPCSVEFKDVSFGYGDKKVLDHVNIKIAKREKIALVGSNGAGKTTLIKLLMRLYDVSDGVISVDGVDIKKFDVEAYRKNIGVVFQDFNIYSATIAENVVTDIFDSSCKGDAEKVTAALESSGFSEKLASFEHGIDTVLTKEFEDDGTELSGGESQKIAIARAFYKDCGLIILDEPSSALDPIAEYKFNRYMADAASDSTVIFISHRLSTTRLADRIVVLEDGRVIEDGTHDELLALGGTYFSMWHAQADKYLT